MPPADDGHGVTVRRAGGGDAAEVAQLLGELGYPDEVEAVAARLRRFATSDRDAVLVAEDGGRVVGVVALSLTPLLAGGGERAAAHEFYPALGYRDQYDHHVLYEKRLDGPAG